MVPKIAPCLKHAGSSAAVQEEAVCLEVALFCDPQGELGRCPERHGSCQLKSRDSMEVKPASGEGSGSWSAPKPGHRALFRPRRTHPDCQMLLQRHSGRDTDGRERALEFTIYEGNTIGMGPSPRDLKDDTERRPPPPRRTVGCEHIRAHQG
ncbi:hypothetical protein R6Z07F_015901 [Ovis aries]